MERALSAKCYHCAVNRAYAAVVLLGLAALGACVIGPKPEDPAGTDDASTADTGIEFGEVGGAADTSTKGPDAAADPDAIPGPPSEAGAGDGDAGDGDAACGDGTVGLTADRKSTRLNSSH